MTEQEHWDKINAQKQQMNHEIHTWELQVTHTKQDMIIFSMLKTENKLNNS